MFKEYKSSNFKVNKLNINQTGFIEENFTKAIEDLYDESDFIIESKIRE